MILSALTGFLAYTLVEYATHRWVLHGPMIAHHSRHHKAPDEEMSTPTFWILIAFLLLWVIFNLWFASGFVACWYLSSIVHHRLHSEVSAPWLSKLVAHHRGHHAKATTNYGVTSTIWDRIFGSHKYQLNN